MNYIREATELQQLIAVRWVQFSQLKENFFGTKHVNCMKILPHEEVDCSSHRRTWTATLSIVNWQTFFVFSLTFFNVMRLGYSRRQSELHVSSYTYFTIHSGLHTMWVANCMIFSYIIFHIVNHKVCNNEPRTFFLVFQPFLNCLNKSVFLQLSNAHSPTVHIC